MKSKKRALYVVEDSGSAQYRYRVQNIMEALGDSSRWNVEYVLRPEIEEVDLKKYDLVIILRQTAKSETLLNFIEKVRISGIKILMDLDDLIFDYRDMPLLMWSTNSKNVFYWMGYFWGIRRVANRVDGFICTNDFLARKLRKSFKKPVRVIPNSLNKKQVEVSENLVQKKRMQKRDNGEFVVGYFSGSPTHIKDFRSIEKELIRFLKAHEGVILRVVGDMKFSRRMNKMIGDKRVKIFRKVNYLKLQELISEVDVNIAPLVINDFTNCKSELKFFEAAVVEISTIASPIYTFKKAIKDGENGFLARQGEWDNKLEYLYNHPEENLKNARQARKYVLKHYYGKDFLKTVEDVYDSLYSSSFKMSD